MRLSYQDRFIESVQLQIRFKKKSLMNHCPAAISSRGVTLGRSRYNRECLAYRETAAVKRISFWYSFEVQNFLPHTIHSCLHLQQ